MRRYERGSEREWEKYKTATTTTTNRSMIKLNLVQLYLYISSVVVCVFFVILETTSDTQTGPVLATCMQRTHTQLLLYMPSDVFNADYFITNAYNFYLFSFSYGIALCHSIAFDCSDHSAFSFSFLFFLSLSLESTSALPIMFMFTVFTI